MNPAEFFWEGITPDAEVELRERALLTEQSLERVHETLDRIVQVLEVLTREMRRDDDG